MNPVNHRVRLIGTTPDATTIVYAAAKQCTSEGTIVDMVDRQLLSTEPAAIEQQGALVKRVAGYGHTSVTEHANWTFAIDGVSRALTHQLVRNRIASYSQQSQRFCDSSDLGTIVPPRIANNPKAYAAFKNIVDACSEGYKELVAILEEAYPGQSIAEDARFVLPNAAASAIIVTMNTRSLHNFFAERCCVRAQWEIRALADSMLALCKEANPVLFVNAGAKCVQRGYCPEGSKSCGRAPTMSALKEAYALRVSSKPLAKDSAFVSEEDNV